MKEPTKLGRPAYLQPEERTKPRTFRLPDYHWEKLKRLGTRWLRKVIEKAKEPPDASS